MTIDEEKISSIYQQGKEQGPPADLDSIILKTAHDAVGRDSEEGSSKDMLSSVKSPFSGGWPAIASIAAVLVITVILVPLVKQEVPPTADFDIADDEQVLMKEHDAVGRSQTVQQDMQQAEKLKKRSLPEKSQPPQETEYKHQIYYESADKPEPGKQEKAGKAAIPLRSAAPLPESRSAMPASVTNGLLADVEEPVLIPAADEWLEKISRLMQAGEIDEARQEFEQFKLHYPDEEVDRSILTGLQEQP